MTVLSDQLEQLRTDKHKAEVEHVRKERERDLEVEALSKEKAALSQLKSELEEKVQKQSAELTNARTEIAKLGTICILHAYTRYLDIVCILFQLELTRSWFAILEAALFNAKSEINRLEKKEDLRKITENHLHESRKEVILQGELLRKYHERFMSKPVASEQEQKSLYKQAFKHQVEALKGELTMKSSEVEALVSNRRRIQ